jgi:hypothetical protein
MDRSLEFPEVVLRMSGSNFRSAHLKKYRLGFCRDYWLASGPRTSGTRAVSAPRQYQTALCVTRGKMPRLTEINLGSGG